MGFICTASVAIKAEWMSGEYSFFLWLLSPVLDLHAIYIASLTWQTVCLMFLVLIGMLHPS